MDESETNTELSQYEIDAEKYLIYQCVDGIKISNELKGICDSTDYEYEIKDGEK